MDANTDLVKTARIKLFKWAVFIILGIGAYAIGMLRGYTQYQKQQIEGDLRDMQRDQAAAAILKPSSPANNPSSTVPPKSPTKKH